MLCFMPVVLCMFLPIPFGPNSRGLKLDLGIVLILAFAGLACSRCAWPAGAPTTSGA
jgi:NADH:ubiquinone oxidoreductase subunit H